MKTRVTLILSVFFTILTPSVLGAVSSFTVKPSNPEQGDTLKISIIADPGEKVPVSLKYSGEASVSNGKYRIKLSDIAIPGQPNSFSARAEGVERLIVDVSPYGIGTISINKQAENGVVTLSQSNIPTLNYDITIRGDAQPGIDEVDLSFNADITLTMDNSGEYTYSYKTGEIPPGTFDVTVGGVSKTITLRAASSGGGLTGGVDLTPDARFTFSGDLVAGSVVSFDAGASNPVSGVITSYRWRFGDGQSGQGVQVSHVYDSPGTYSVELSVQTSVGLVGTKSVTITVEEKPNVVPVTLPGSDRRVFTGQQIDLRSKSWDPDGEITCFLWDFDDGSTGVGRVVEHSWSEPGVYYINHSVVDDRGAVSTGYVTVVVEETSVERVNSKEIALEGRFFQHFDDLGASVLADGNGTRLYLFQYGGNPHPDSPLPEYQQGMFLDLVVANPDLVTWPVYFEMGYNGSLVSELVEPSLGLSYYHDDGWERCSRTGVYTDRDTVWANLTREELSGSPLTVSMVPPLPYFTYTGLELQHDTVEEGEAASLEFTVSNNGEKNGNLVSIVYMDDTPIASKTLHLEKGETQKHRIRFNVSERGEHLIRVDDMETGLTVVPPTLPDLICNVSAIGEVTEGEKVDLNYTVTNTGNRTAVGFVTKLSVGGLTVYSSRVEELCPGETHTKGYTWIADKAGEYEVRYSVDTSGVVDEVDEGNNTSEALIDVKAPLNMAYVVSAVLLVAFALAAAYWYRLRS